MKKLDSNEDPCLLLDDYVDGVLSERDATSFESHLKSCPACRTAIDQQAWIDELLGAAADEHFERAPAAQRAVLIAELRARERQRVVRRLLTGLAAAAAILLAFAFWPRGDEPQQVVEQHAEQQIVEKSSKPDDSRVAQSSHATEDVVVTQVADIADNRSVTPEQVEEPVRVAKFHSDGDVIAVQLESESPDVTVFQLYETTDAQRRRRLDAMLTNVSYRTNGEW